VKELLPEEIEVTKKRRDKPLNSSKGCTERPCTEVLEQALKLCVQGDEFCGGAFRHFKDFFGEDG
jgi:hypothetical protein